MNYYVMCETCPAQGSWYYETSDKATVEEYGRIHTETYGHSVTYGQHEESFLTRRTTKPEPEVPHGSC